MPPEGPCPGHILPGTQGCSPEAPLPWPDLRPPLSEKHDKRSRPRLFFPRRIFLRSGRCIFGCGRCCSAGRSETRRSFPRGPDSESGYRFQAPPQFSNRCLPGQSLLYKCHSLFPGQNNISRTSRTLPRCSQSARSHLPGWLSGIYPLHGSEIHFPLSAPSGNTGRNRRSPKDQNTEFLLLPSYYSSSIILTPIIASLFLKNNWDFLLKQLTFEK